MRDSTVKKSRYLIALRDSASRATIPANSDSSPLPEPTEDRIALDGMRDFGFRKKGQRPGVPDAGVRSVRRRVSIPSSLEAKIVKSSNFQALDYEAMDIVLPAVPGIPVIVSCPHAGREYPGTMMEHVRGGVDRLRGLEDFAVDRLVRGLPACGAPALINRVARAYLDVSRNTTALDRSMFYGEVNATQPCKHVCSGYGLIPRLTAERQNIYDHRLPCREVATRIGKVHRPYHSALAKLIRESQKRHGSCILLDLHSMPACDHFNRKLPDIVCGDVHGRTLSLANRKIVTQVFEVAGLSVGWNTPYAGGYITEAYGRAKGQCQSVQIEINRALYMQDNFRTDEKAARSLARTLETLVEWVGEATMYRAT